MSITVTSPSNNECVSSINGDAAVLQARQLLLRWRAYGVSSYTTSAALLAEQRSREFRVGLGTHLTGNGDGLAVLHDLRSAG